jgi:hypothetical protein
MISWNWIRLAITYQWVIPAFWFLQTTHDPCPAQVSNKQCDRSLEREFVVLKVYQLPSFVSQAANVGKLLCGLSHVIGYGIGRAVAISRKSL